MHVVSVLFVFLRHENHMNGFCVWGEKTKKPKQKTPAKVTLARHLDLRNHKIKNHTNPSLQAPSYSLMASRQANGPMSTRHELHV